MEYLIVGILIGAAGALLLARVLWVWATHRATVRRRMLEPMAQAPIPRELSQLGYDNAAALKALEPAQLHSLREAARIVNQRMLDAATRQDRRG